MEHECEGVVSIEHDEFVAAQELERRLRLRRSWGRADGEPTNGVVAYHDKPHGSIARSVELLGYGAHYLSKMSLAAHALVHGELFDDPEVVRATLEAEMLNAQLNDAQPRLGAYSDGGVAGSGANGSSAAIIRFWDTDVTLNIRLVPIGRRLSSLVGKG